MPLFIFIVAALIVVFGLVVYKARKSKETGQEKSKALDYLIFCISLISAFIYFSMFRNLFAFVNQYNYSPDVILGGVFWLYMTWAGLGLLVVLCIISGFNAFKRTK